MSVGEKIKAAGWRQGSLFRRADLLRFDIELLDEQFAIVVSQSCDVVHHSIEAEPNIEIAIVSSIEACEGQYTHAKHSRRLHFEVSALDGAAQPVELVPYARHFLPREALTDLTPDPDWHLLEQTRLTLANWLAGRYTRAALPDEFNRRINLVGHRKSKKIAARLSKHVSALYVRIHPFDEIGADKPYAVNLLALIPEQYAHEQQAVLAAIEDIAALMRDSNMNVGFAARVETQISLAHLREFKKLDFDALSLKNEPMDPFPPEPPA